MPFAGNDTTIMWGESIHLRDLGKPGYGKIVSWKWQLPGASTFIPVSKGDTIVAVTLREPANYTLVVTDEFGQSASSSIKVTIAQPMELWRPIAIELPYIEAAM